MRESIRDKGRLEHMIEMAQALKAESTRHTYEDILNDRVLFFGLTKMTEIIGEAAYKLTHEFVANHPELPWQQIVGMRHILVHGYFKISPEDLWNTIENDIPPMIPILEKYLAEFKE